MASEIIKMNSTGLNAKGKRTGYYKTTKKNKKNTPDKFKRKMFDPHAIHPETGKKGAHVMFEEGKISK